MGNTAPVIVKVPSGAVDDGHDLVKPVTDLLNQLSLLGTPTEQQKAGSAGAVFSGPPDSVALLEAGATALTKWWAAGLGAAVGIAWGAVRAFWLSPSAAGVHRVVLWGTSIVTVALVLGLAIIVSTDVRSRAAAQVATIGARSAISQTMVQSAMQVWKPASVTTSAVPMPAGIELKYLPAKSTAEAHWTGLLMTTHDDPTKILYLVAKGDEQHWAKASEVTFQ